jgi:hypothetical protein
MMNDLCTRAARTFTIWGTFILWVLAYTLPSPKRFILAITTSVASILVPTLFAPLLASSDDGKHYVIFFYTIFWVTIPAHDWAWRKSYSSIASLRWLTDLSVFKLIIDCPYPVSAFILLFLCTFAFFIAFDYLFYAMFSYLRADLGVYGEFHKHIVYGVQATRKFGPVVGDLVGDTIKGTVCWVFWQEGVQMEGTANDSDSTTNNEDQDSSKHPPPYTVSSFFLIL